MARLSIEQRIAQLDARKQALRARLTTQERARDTRRKVLLGALVLQKLDHSNDPFAQGLRDWMARELPAFLSRDVDKALFADLIPNSASETGLIDQRDGSQGENAS